MNKELKLKSAIGETVRLVNAADVEGIPGKIRIHAYGELLEPDDTGEWTVRVIENREGVSVIGFALHHVLDAFRQSSGMFEITIGGAR